MQIEFAVLLGLLSAVLGIVGALATMRKSAKSEGRELASIKTNIEYVVRVIDDIRLDQKETARKVDLWVERVIRNEEAIKSLQNQINKKGDK